MAPSAGLTVFVAADILVRTRGTTPLTARSRCSSLSRHSVRACLMTAAEPADISFVAKFAGEHALCVDAGELR